MIKRIRILMSEQKIKQKDLVAFLEEKQGTVARWLSENEKIRNDIPNTILLKIALFLKVDVEYLMGLQDERVRVESSLFSTIPLIGRDSIFPTLEELQKDKQPESIALDKKLMSQNMYAIEIKTTSMYPTIKIGDIAWCRPNINIEIEDNLVVHYQYKDKIGIARIKIDKDTSQIVLVPDNIEEYRIITIPERNEEDLKISKIIGFSSKLKDKL